MAELQTDTYRAALKAARGSFDRATKALADAEAETVRRKRELSLLRRTITALAAQCSEEPWGDPLGITESCMEVMEEVMTTMTTQEVVSSLERMGFDIASQKNIAASVHTVLSRLADKDKIKKITGDDDKVIGWRGPNYDEEYARSMEISDDDIPF